MLALTAAVSASSSSSRWVLLDILARSARLGKQVERSWMMVRRISVTIKDQPNPANPAANCQLHHKVSG